ncbi:primase-helicase family protein [Novispirillum itersonii]|uniref:primase-helicase family protein n=1 Tax=Novispirillum itersonii TaxID=189 RepID=UPI00037D7EF1|nr:primase-helicase family protein [Novispirillum itersonii]
MGNIVSFPPQNQQLDDLKNQYFDVQAAIADVKNDSDLSDQDKATMVPNLLVQLGGLKRQLKAGGVDVSALAAGDGGAGAMTPAAPQDLTSRVAELIERLDPYYISSFKSWSIRSESGERVLVAPEALKYSHIQALGAGGISEWDSQIQSSGRIKLTVGAYPPDACPGDVLNLLDVAPLPAVPESGQPHWIFGTLLQSVCGGDEAAVEHVEQLLVFKYRNPADFTIPWLVLNDAGGTGKTLLGDVVISHMFGHRAHSANLSIDAVVGRFTGSALTGKLTGMVNEVPADRTDMNSLKQVIGSPTISVEFKGKDRLAVNNMLWCVMSSNDKSGTVRLSGDSTDRRFSVVKGSRPLKDWIADRLGVPADEAEDWLFGDGQQILKDREQFSIWFNCLLTKHSDLRSVRAFHGRAYRESLETSMLPCERLARHIFQDANFTHISVATLFDYYCAAADSAGIAQKFRKNRNSFIAFVKSWIELNAPHLEYVRNTTWRDGAGNRQTVTVIRRTDAGPLVDNNSQYPVGAYNLDLSFLD